MSKVKVGDRYGEWRVIGVSPKKHHFICVCSCGTYKNIYDYNLIKGMTTKCQSHVATQIKRYGKPGRIWKRLREQHKLCKEWHDSCYLFVEECMVFKPWLGKYYLRRLDESLPLSKTNFRWVKWTPVAVDCEKARKELAGYIGKERAFRISKQRVYVLLKEFKALG